MVASICELNAFDPDYSPFHAELHTTGVWFPDHDALIINEGSQVAIPGKAQIINMTTSINIQ